MDMRGMWTCKSHSFWEHILWITCLFGITSLFLAVYQNKWTAGLLSYKVEKPTSKNGNDVHSIKLINYVKITVSEIPMVPYVFCTFSCFADPEFLFHKVQTNASFRRPLEVATDQHETAE